MTEDLRLRTIGRGEWGAAAAMVYTLTSLQTHTGLAHP